MLFAVRRRCILALNEADVRPKHTKILYGRVDVGQPIHTGGTNKVLVQIDVSAAFVIMITIQ